MNRKEFEKEIMCYKNNIGAWQIVIDELCMADFVIGCYWDESDKLWKIYINNERGRHRIRLKTVSEDEAFDKLYEMIRIKAEVYMYCRNKE